MHSSSSWDRGQELVWFGAKETSKGYNCNLKYPMLKFQLQKTAEILKASLTEITDAAPSAQGKSDPGAQQPS